MVELGQAWTVNMLRQKGVEKEQKKGKNREAKRKIGKCRKQGKARAGGVQQIGCLSGTT